MEVPILPVVAAAGFGAICLALWYVYRHWLPMALGWLALAVSGSLLLASFLIVTPREQIERAIGRLAAAVHHNDAEGVVALISRDAPEMRAAARRDMDSAEFMSCWVVKIHNIDIDFNVSPPTAKAALAIVVDVVESPYGAGRGRVQIWLDMVRESDDEWRVKAYRYSVE